MSAVIYQRFSGRDVTDTIVDAAATLFSEHYGVWGFQTKKAGSRVKLTGELLRQQYLPATDDACLVTVHCNGKLVGHVIATHWQADGMQICWVTQLVVHRLHREKGLAGGLLNLLRSESNDVYGIISSHPAACLAAVRQFGNTIEKISLDFIAKHAALILEASPIKYIREAELCGTLFGKSREGIDTVSAVDVRFFVDHEEPLSALAEIRTRWNWPLGELFEGQEFILLLQARRRLHLTHVN